MGNFLTILHLGGMDGLALILPLALMLVDTALGIGPTRTAEPRTN